MKIALIFVVFISLSQLVFAQRSRQSIDYQYHRDDKTYYAYELFRNSKNDSLGMLKINFTLNNTFTKIDKIYIKTGEVKVKLKFKKRPDRVSSDNAEQRFYPIIFNGRDLYNKKVGCEAEIIFIIDNGSAYTLPFNPCMAKELVKN